MTNAEYIKAIEMRTSRRSYKSISLDKDTVSIIKDMVDYVNGKANLNFVFIEDASFAFNIFSGKFSAIAVCGPDTIAAREDCGYYGETIVLQCAYHGLGTCWVSSTYNENKMLEALDLPKKVKNKVMEFVGPGVAALSADFRIAAVVVALIIYFLFTKELPHIGYIKLIAFTIIFSVVGQIGDLVESSIKRHFGVKDSGKILPGHGGILDRFDNLIFVFPIMHLLGLF